MNSKPFNASPKWFAALAALLVALGAQVLLESVVPASIADLPFSAQSRALHVSGESFWASESIIRFFAFAIGGVVAVLLARGLSRGLLALLLGVAILVTVFAQLPSPSAFPSLVLWSLAGPVGVLVGAWSANARRAKV